MGRKRASVKTNGVAQPEAEEKVVAKAEGKKESEEMQVEPEKVEPMETDQPAPQPAKDAKKPESEKKVNENAEGSGEEEGGEEEENDEGKDDKLPSHKSLFIKIIGFKRLPKLDDELKLYNRFFTEAMEIVAPKIQIPGPEDRWVYFELHSLEDRAKLFTELKSKGHVWEGYKLSVKSVIIRAPEESKELRRMSVEEALKILYPLKDAPYAQQLRDKLSRAKDLVDEVIPRDALGKYTKSKKYVSNLRVKDMVPMLPIEGHEYTTTIYIEEDPETGAVVYGLRAISEDKESIGIVPLDLCISVPLQMKLLVKSFISSLPDIGLKPYNYVKKEGDVLGITLKMTLCARFVMTLIVPKMPKIIAVSFKQLTPDGVEKENEDDEGPNQNESYSVMIKKKTEEIKEKCEKYYSDEGKKFSLDSVYIVMSFPTNLKDESSILATHILGLSFVPDNLNGVLHRLTGERSRPPIDALRPILGLIEAHAGINASSRVYLASPFRLVGLYFAKKCAHVTMCFSWTKDNLIELQNWAKSINLNNIEFTNAKTHHRKTFPADNAIAIFWQFTKPTLVDRLLISGVTNVASISYWNKTPPPSYVDQQKRQYETLFSKLKITHIYPVDLAPFTERIGLGIFFNGLLPYATQHFHRENVPAPMPLLGPHGPIHSPNRMGPPPGGMRGGPFVDRPGPWQRPDPWGPPGRSQVPQVLPRNLPPQLPLRHSLGKTRYGEVGASRHRPSSPLSYLANNHLDQVASGVMQNLQAVQQQMQAFIPSLMDAAPMRPPPANPSWNKRNRDDFANDSWGYGKRRRDERGDWKRNNFGKGKMKK